VFTRELDVWWWNVVDTVGESDCRRGDWCFGSFGESLHPALELSVDPGFHFKPIASGT
jgi:hypothetical protein